MKTLNIKNKGIIGAAALLLGMGAVSCSDMLDTKPQGVILAEQMGEEQTYQLLISAYSTLTNHYFGNNESFAGPINNWVIDLRSDDALKGGGDITMESYMHDMEIGNIQNNSDIVNFKWKNNYFSISRCNTAIKAILEAGNLDAATKASQIAEMKTLRAYYYFDLLRLYKQFPYFTETTTDPGSVRADQYTKMEIAEFIKEDLRESYQNLPESQAEVGRFNKYVAAAILARVDLFTATSEYSQNIPAVWAEVEEYCDYVINSGKYALFNHFQDISIPQMNNGPESVFAVQFSLANFPSQTNYNNCLNCTYSEGQVYGSGDDFYLGSQDLINAFRTNESGLPYLDGYTGNDIIGRVDGLEEILPLYTGNVDPRLDLTFGRIGMYWRADNAHNYVYNEEWCRSYSLYGQFSGKKPYPAPYNPDVHVGEVPWGASSLNYMIVRYSDILLMKAEALVEQNKGAAALMDAIGLVNQVRQRAANSIDMSYVPMDLNPDIVDYKVSTYPLTGLTQDNVRQAVRYERRLEFALEGLRWFDLLRWGEAVSTVNAYYQYESQFQPYYVSANLTSDELYLPIPLNQVDNAGDLYK